MRNAKKPLFQISSLDDRIASPAATINNLFIGKHRVATGTPVHGRVLTVSKPSLVHFEKQPLIPLVIRPIARRELTFPGITNPETLQLIFHVRDVVSRPRFRVGIVLNRGVLCRHTESIPTEWM